MSTTREQARNAILDVLGNHFKAAVGHVRDEDAPMLIQISDAAAGFAVRKAAGDEEAVKDLEHAEAQVKLLAAKVLIRENREVVDTLLRVVTIGAEVAAQFILRVT